MWAAAAQGKDRELRVMLQNLARSRSAVRIDDPSPWSGHTMLGLAVANGRTGTTRLLLECGARVDAREFHTRRTPLHLAAAHGRIGLARFLLSAGASPRARDSEDETPLHLAASSGRLKLLTVLLDSDKSELGELVTVMGDPHSWRYSDAVNELLASRLRQYRDARTVAEAQAFLRG